MILQNYLQFCYRFIPEISFYKNSEDSDDTVFKLELLETSSGLSDLNGVSQYVKEGGGGGGGGCAG